MSNVSEDTESELGKSPQPLRQRSTIGFPYMDLKQASQLAEAIYENVGLGECEDDQLAAWTKQSSKSSSFRVQIYTARMFGLLSGEGSRNRLTDLGRMIVDPSQARQAKATAFLNVPLYKAVFDKFKGGVLPPSSALEREMANLGVAEKQKDRARLAFERSAEQAGFFEHGRNRLIMPGIQTALSQPTLEADGAEEAAGKDNFGDSRVSFELDPLLLAMLEKIPPKEDGWPKEKRVRWFKTFAMNVSQVYDEEDDPVDIDIALAKTNGGQGNV